MWSDPERIFMTFHYLSVRRLQRNYFLYFRQTRKTKELQTIINIIGIYAFSQCRNRKMIKKAIFERKLEIHIWKSALIPQHISLPSSPSTLVKLRRFNLMMMYDVNFTWIMQGAEFSNKSLQPEIQRQLLMNEIRENFFFPAMAK